MNTPGADQAASSASILSDHERTVPDSTTFPSFELTEIRSASTVALRFSAFLITSLTSNAFAFACATVMALVIPVTPARQRTISSAEFFWNW
jgi:hypothetical protein